MQPATIDQLVLKQHTSLGKTFSAARLGTEKPPCVLVSLAVKVLQKKSFGCRFGVPTSGGRNKSLSCCNHQGTQSSVNSETISKGTQIKGKILPHSQAVMSFVQKPRQSQDQPGSRRKIY